MTDVVHTSVKGNLAEAATLADLLRLGYNPMIPWGGNARYDIGVDVGGRLVRVQCKTAWAVSENHLRFKARSNSGWRGSSQRGYAGEADHFAVYLPETGDVLYVPVEGLPVAQINLYFHSDSPTARLVENYRKPAF